jgi:hypothetical protein
MAGSMTDDRANRGSREETPRQQRLAAALRDNLARRKAQQRARATAGSTAAAAPPALTPDADPDDSTPGTRATPGKAG